MQIAGRPPTSIDQVPSRAVLRDGSVATVRVATRDDHAALTRFFHELSPESRRRRFFSFAEPTPALIDAFCDSTDPSRQTTLLALRLVDGELRPIAVGSYIDLGKGVAESAFAVADAFHGKGLGTVLLERLAGMAASHGFQRFDAIVLPENKLMVEVFKDSGFEIRSRSGSGFVTVQLAISPTAASVAASDRRQALATVASMRPMLAPRSVAVIGASREPSGISGRTLRALMDAGFHGPVYPINPHASEIEGLRCYHSIGDAPHGIDLAIVAVPAAAVLEAAEQCAGAGVKGLLVISAGFAEVGDAGRALQERLVETVRGHGMRMIGPNCMGLLNTAPDVCLNASFSPVVPPHGRVAFSSQSGALGLSILELARDRAVGLSGFVSVGNKADVSSNDLLEYWEADGQTAVILLYLESFGNPRRFAQIARRIGRVKPIVAVKAGRTTAGGRAASSHTAALASSDTTVDALFHQAGVIRADTIDELFDIAACLDAQPLPRGRRVAIVTNAGGPGILAVDACEAAGLTVPPFSADTRAQFATFLPSEASVGNPVDMVASATPDVYRRAVEAALLSGDSDAVIIIYTPVDPQTQNQTVQAICDGIAAARRAGVTHKPVLACLMASAGRPQPIDAAGERVPCYAFPENCARALARAATYSEWRAQPPALLWTFDDIRSDEARAVCRRALKERGEGWLSGDDVAAVLGAFGLPLAAGMLVQSAEAATAAARVIGFPVAAKLAARSLQHKTDVGAVQLNLTGDEAVARAYVEIMNRGRGLVAESDIEGVLVQAMVGGGVETMIGVSSDPLFGPVVAFGLGGIHVEVLGDVRFRMAPLSDREVDELLNDIRGARLLRGYRGHSPADIDALREMLLRVSRLAVDVPEIVELDLNPVMALPPGHGCRIVDARIRVR